MILLNKICVRKSRPFISIAKKCFSSTMKSSNTLELLKERALLRVSGSDVSEFLQGLITNDISHLNCEQNSMYTMLLNTKGRVLYDSIIYNNTLEENTFYIECDVQAEEQLQKHLKMYRVRRKVDITSVKDEYRIYAFFNTDNAFNTGSESSISYKIDGSIAPCDKLNETRAVSKVEIYGDVQVYNDPRNVYLGSRVIAPENVDVHKKISEILKMQLPVESPMNYRSFRYHLGVGEGVNDLPPGNCFPLESNCDYLHGVSFHKGCYIGQELTARTHHTGVVRKRLMPLLFSTPLTNYPKVDTITQNEDNLGKLRGVEGNVGLALLRIAKAINAGDIKIGNGVAKTVKPKWWPIEMPKEKMSETVT